MKRLKSIAEWFDDEYFLPVVLNFAGSAHPDFVFLITLLPRNFHFTSHRILLHSSKHLHAHPSSTGGENIAVISIPNTDKATPLATRVHYHTLLKKPCNAARMHFRDLGS